MELMMPYSGELTDDVIREQLEKADISYKSFSFTKGSTQPNGQTLYYIEVETC